MQQNQQHMTEQQFLRILTSSVCGILLCLVGLVGTTWAWYTMDIVCTNNVIQVGQFDAVVTVTQDDIALTAGDENAYALNAGTYQVRVESREGSTSPGFCVVRLWEDQTWQTIPLYPGDHDGGQPSAMTFELVLAEDAWVEFLPMLGKPTAELPVADGGRIAPEEDGSEQPDPGDESPEPEEP